MRLSRRPRALLAPVLLAGLLAAGSPAPARAAAPPPPPPPGTVLGGDALGTRGTVAALPAPPLPRTSAAGVLVADLDSGEVLAAKDPHGRYAPASTLKTLTAVALLPRLDPEARVRPAFEDVNVDGSKVGVVTTMSYPVRELMAAMLVVSGNDAAGALATAVGGTASAAGLMNAEAARLQARDTRAVNPSGLDAKGQVSSAYDLALIARAGMAMPAFREHVATQTSSISAPKKKRIEIYNHNRLLREYDGAIGIKNGYTTAARASFVGAATRGGRTLVVTLLRADPLVWREAEALLDWGFAAVAAKAAPVGQLVDPLPEPRPVEEGAVAAAPGPPLEAVPASVQEPVVEDDGGLPWRSALGVLLVLLAALVARRRQVVLRRRRRRRQVPLPRPTRA